MLVEKETRNKSRKFSIWIYILIVYALSWPFPIIGAIWGASIASAMGTAAIWVIYIFNSISMIMVTVATYILGKYIFKDGFKDSGWSWGKPVHYLVVLGWVLFLYFLPTVIDYYQGSATFEPGSGWYQLLLLMVGMTIATVVPAFGEEFGWRGYMLPHIAQTHSPRKAVLLHNIIWWAWHIPMLATGWIILLNTMGMGTVAVSIIMGMIVTLIGQGVIFAYVWVKSQSLAVSTFLHTTNNGIKDSIFMTMGVGSLTGLSTTFVLVIVGTILLWRGDWKKLGDFKNK